MNVFSSNLFLVPLAQVYFPGRAFSIEHFRVEGQVYRLLVIGDGPPITSWAFLDFVEPLAVDPPTRTAPRDLGYLPLVARAKVRAEEAWPGDRIPGTPAPLVDWTMFPTWRSFLDHPRQAPRVDTPRARRRLERELGPACFTYRDDRPDAFEACLRWKSAQYVASDLVDAFARPEHVAFFRRLRDDGALVISSLRAGGELLAVHLGLEWEGRFYWWIPAHDPARARHSPGTILLEALLEESHRQGHREFDFLVGGESYKWRYATHVRSIGELGEPPLGLRLRRRAKQGLKSTLRQVPGLWEATAGLRRTLRLRAGSLGSFPHR